MTKSTIRRSLAVGSFGILGSVLAFLVGAQLGARLEHHTAAISNQSSVRAGMTDMTDSIDRTPTAVSLQASTRSSTH